MKHKTFISVVVRVHDDGDAAGEFLRRVDDYMYDHWASYEYVVVDDASTDDTRAVVQAAAADLKAPMTVLVMSQRHGVELATLAGLERAMGDFVFELDHVGEDFPIEMLGTLYDTATTEGYDVVAAGPRRLPPHWRAFYWVCNRFSRFQPALTEERIRVVSRRALDAMLRLRERVRFRQVLYRLTGYRHRRLAYEARSGSRHRSAREQSAFGLNVLVTYTDAGIRSAHLLALVFQLIAAAVLVYAVVRALVDENLPPGWESVAVLGALGFGGVFMLLGLTAEYLARILAEVRSRPLYTVDKTQQSVITPTQTARPPAEVPAEERVEHGPARPLATVVLDVARDDLRRASGAERPAGTDGSNGG